MFLLPPGHLLFTSCIINELHLLWTTAGDKGILVWQFGIFENLLVTRNAAYPLHYASRDNLQDFWWVV